MPKTVPYQFNKSIFLFLDNRFKRLGKHITLVNGKTKIITQKYLCGFQPKQVKKILLQNILLKTITTWKYGNSNIKDTWKNIQPYRKVEANKGQSSISKSLEALASNKVLHQETFTISSYQVKKGQLLSAALIILTYTSQRTMEKYVKLTKVLFPDKIIPE